MDKPAQVLRDVRNLQAHIGPYHAKLVFGYRRHGKRWGKINFGNGFTLRANRIALHLWKLTPREYAKTRGSA